MMKKIGSVVPRIRGNLPLFFVPPAPDSEEPAPGLRVGVAQEFPDLQTSEFPVILETHNQTYILKLPGYFFVFS